MAATAGGMRKIDKNDRHDLSRAEALLIRAGHWVWLERRAALKSGMVSELRVLDEALETIWTAKREVRKEQKAERAEAARKVREYFQQRKAA
jgi:hypothetical protein